MQQQGFLDPSPRRPATLTIVVVAHVAVLVAVMISSPEVVRQVFTPIQLIPIAADPPPPPPPAKTQPDKPKSQPSQIDVPKHPLVSLPADDTQTVDHSDEVKPSDPGALPGQTEPGTGAEPRPVQPPAPVIVGASVDPRYADRLQPPYPPSMERLQREGTATVRVLIGADGRVKQAVPVSATDPAFAEATVRQALKAWRFRPATRDGVAEESWKTLTVRFVLTSR